MKMTTVRALTLGVLLTAGVLAQPVFAGEKEAAVTIPNTSAAIWQSIDSQTNEIATLIQAGTLKDLHHHAFAIRDLVAGLPAHSAALPADKLAKVKSDGKFVATLATRLDAAGDSNDKTGAESNFDKLKNVLNALRSNYPDAMPVKANSTSDTTK
jgi:hypothetical protein